MSEVTTIPAPTHGGLIKSALLVCLSCYVLSCGIWIDLLNARAGQILPRAVNNSGGNPKWRVAAESALRMDSQYRIEAGLTPISEKEIELHRRESQLRSAVSDYGILQYLLCPLIILFGAIWIACPAQYPTIDRAVGILTIVAGFTGIYLAWTREYLSSLGW